MKKLVLFFAVVAAVAFAACTGSQNNQGSDKAADTTAVCTDTVAAAADTLNVDSAAVDTTIAE